MRVILWAIQQIPSMHNSDEIDWILLRYTNSNCASMVIFAVVTVKVVLPYAKKGLKINHLLHILITANCIQIHLQ